MAQYKLVLHLTYVKAARPQRLLKVEIHLMKQPDEFVEPKYLDYASKIKHVLYGRKIRLAC